MNIWACRLNVAGTSGEKWLGNARGRTIAFNDSIRRPWAVQVFNFCKELVTFLDQELCIWVGLEVNDGTTGRIVVLSHVG